MRRSVLALAALLTGAFVFGEIRVGPTRVAALRRGDATVSGAYYGTASVYSTSTDVVTDGIVAWWKLDDNAATTDVLDSSGNGYHGTLTGMTQDSSVEGAYPSLGRAFSFTDAPIEMASQPALIGAFSVSFWMNMSPIWNVGPFVGTNEDILQHATQGWTFMQLFAGMYLNINSGTYEGENELQVFWEFFLPGGVWEHMDDQWHHVAMTYDGVSGYGTALYFDGVLRNRVVQHDTLVSFPVSSSPLKIGGYTASAQYYGKLDDIRIYDRVLTPEEAVEIYTFYSGNPAPPPPPPPSETITVTFDAGYDGYADFTEAEYTPGATFDTMPYAYSYIGGYYFSYWRDENWNIYDVYSTVPSQALTLYAEYYYY